eukprot:COSAG01_NODE_17425_length_1152_cov_2.063628_2_plen_91_part_00
MGHFDVAPPKRRRKAHDHCFRVDIKDTEGDDGEEEEGRKFILSAESAEEMASWMDTFARIQAAAAAEQTAAQAAARARQVCADRSLAACY